MWKKSERQVESYKIWAMAVLFTGSCISLFYFHVILGIDTIVTHIFYVPIVLAAFWWKRKGLVVALFSSGLLIVSHVFLRPDMASHNDYFRAFMFMVTAFLVAELSRRIAKEHEALQTANQQLKADEQQLKASNQQLSANEQQLVSEVAERKNAEERIREQHEFLRNTIESLSHPFYVIDANDNTVKMANSTALQGKLPEKITCYMLSHKRNKPCSGADHPCPLEDIKKTKQPVTVEHIHYDKDGNPRNIEVHAHPIFDNEQNVTQIIEYCLDITERKLAEEELKKERDFSENLINTAQAIVLVLDTDGKIVSFNPYMEELSGYRLEEVKGKDWFTTFLPECDYDEIRRIFKKAISDIQTRGNANHIVRKDGEQRFIEWHDKALKDDKGNVIGLLATGQDITERKKTEDELKKQQYYLEKAQELGKIGTWELNLIQNKLFWTDENCRIFGVPEGSVVNYEIFLSIVHPDDREYVDQEWKAALERKPYDIEHRITVDGKTKWVREKADVEYDEHGKATSAIGFTQDITDRKRAKEALQEFELKFKTIFENAGGAIFIADNKTGKILECNSQAEQLLGRPRAEIIGMHQSELHPQGGEKKYKEKFAAHVQKGHAVDFEGEVQRRDGRRTPVWIAAQCLKIGGKDVIIGLFIDTTEIKKAEQKILDHQEQLKSLVSELSVTEERERRRIAMELHDHIGQSLVFSKLKLDELHHSATSSELTKALDEICNNIGQIIQDTRTLTFDLSSPILNEIGLEAAVANWLDVQILEKHGIKTEFVDDGQQKPLDDDIKALLFRNVRELLVNMIKHANAHKVKVSIRRVDEHIHIDVEDDGKGFDAVKVTSTAAKETKFGLFSIRQRLEQLGGQFEIDSETGRGSKFMMTVPLKGA